MMQEGIKDIAKAMKGINISYVYYFNQKYKKVGHLFQDRFKSEVIENERYALSLLRYIHQNPVKAGIVKKIGDYKWSSYNAYMQENHYFQKVVDTTNILGFFSGNPTAAKRQFAEYINQECDDLFMDLEEKEAKMDEENAQRLLYELKNRQSEEKRNNNKQITEAVIREFSEKTNWSIRQIAAITGLNKDKINKMLRS
jgi:hypothetical protein